MRVETRGRKKLSNPSTKISLNIPYDVNQYLEIEMENIKINTGVEAIKSQVVVAWLRKVINLQN